jgi:hypothetical protein
LRKSSFRNLSRFYARATGSDSASDIPFDWILAEVLNKHGTLEFVLRDPAKCPRCNRQIAEKTFVKCTSDSLDYDHRILIKRKCHVPHSMFS